MTPEGTETFIWAFNSKIRQSVAHNTHKLFLIDNFCPREDTFRHFKGLISDSRGKEFSRYKEDFFFAFFHRF